jgi:hypothetical protein
MRRLLLCGREQPSQRMARSPSVHDELEQSLKRVLLCFVYHSFWGDQ